MSRLPSEEVLSIGEVAARVDATPAALRYWERAGLLDPVERVGGRRRYRSDAVTRVGLIRLCQDAGFGIGEIRVLLDETDPLSKDTWRASAEAKLRTVEQQITRLRSAAELLEHTLACPHPTLGECPTFAAFVRWRAEGGPPPEEAGHPEADTRIDRSGGGGGDGDGERSRGQPVGR